MDYLRDQHYDNDARTDEHTSQLDYTNPITKQHQIDAGCKYQFYVEIQSELVKLFLKP